jgi:hypothetical protein
MFEEGHDEDPGIDDGATYVPVPDDEGLRLLKFHVWLVPEGPGLTYEQFCIVNTSPITGLKLVLVSVGCAFVKANEDIEIKSKSFFMFEF